MNVLKWPIVVDTALNTVGGDVVKYRIVQEVYHGGGKRSRFSFTDRYSTAVFELLIFNLFFLQGNYFQHRHNVWEDGASIFPRWFASREN